jgi:tryptophan-rich sensory protein
VPSDELRQLLLKTAERERPAKRLRFRESGVTRILGTLSASFGTAALLGIAYIWYNAGFIGQSAFVRLDPTHKLRIPFTLPPDPSCAPYWGIAVVGQLVGIAMVWRSRKMKGTISLLSVLGIALGTAALLPLYLQAVLRAVALGWLFILPVAVLALVVIVQPISRLSRRARMSSGRFGRAPRRTTALVYAPRGADRR